MATILIVDDSPELLHLVSMCMKLFGHESLTAQSSDEVFKLLETEQPDLMIIDVMLGNDDGRDVCHRIKNSHNKNIPVILYSAAAHLLINNEFHCADDTMEKPFDIYTLRSKVDRLLSAA